MADLAPTVPTLAQMAGYGDSYLKPGNQVYVIAEDIFYTYRNTGSLPVIDGFQLVKANYLPGFWVRGNSAIAPNVSVDVITLPELGIIPNDPTLNTINTTRMNSLLFTYRTGRPGPAIYAPTGTYYFNGQLLMTLLAGCHLYGDGDDATVFDYNGPTDRTLDFILFLRNNECVVERITFYVEPETGFLPVTGHYRVNNVLRITSGGPGFGGSIRNQFRNCRFQGGFNGFYMGSDLDVDVNMDLTTLYRCSVRGNDQSNVVVSNTNTNNTSFNDCSFGLCGHWSFQVKNYPRATTVRNPQVSNYGSLQPAGTSGAFRVEATFGSNLTIEHIVWELEEGHPLLSTDTVNGGLCPTGVIILRDHHITNNSIGGSNPIIDYKGAGDLILEDFEVAGSAGGVISVNPPAAPITGGSRQLVTRGKLLLHDGATMAVRTDGDYPMGWVGTKPVTVTSLGTTDQTETGHVLYAGKNLGTKARYECLPAIIPNASTGTVKRNIVSAYAIKAELPYTLFATGGAVTTFDLTHAILSGKTFLTKIQAAIVLAGDTFAGTGITGVTMSVGDTTNGGVDGYLLDFDVFTGVTRKGGSDDDLGPVLTQVQAIQGGRILAWDGVSSQILVRIKTVGGTVAALTQGKLTLWFNIVPLE